MEDIDQTIRDMSLRYQLSPGRFRYYLPEQMRLISFMIDAPEWLPSGTGFLGVRITPTGEFAALSQYGVVVMIANGRKVMKSLIDDIITRAELGEEDSDYLLGMPRVNDMTGNGRLGDE